MSINEWWLDDDEERFWVEVTDRESLGSNLIAPQLGGGGRPTPSYTLVNHVSPGDIVLHWWKIPGAEASIVGSSVVAGDPFESSIEWQARGSYGRERGRPTIGAAWEAPLSGFQELAEPVTLEQLRALEPNLKVIRDELQAVHGATYFPFAFSEKRPMRTGQGYLFKLPKAAVELVPELDSVRRSAPQRTGARRRGTRPRSARVSAEFRKAVERHAVDWTMDYLSQSGYQVEDVGATESYDVFALSESLEEVHVEVKGSSGEAIAVGLTDGEVKHWGHDYERVLVVLDGIRVSQLPTGEYETTGGRARVWWEWEIDEGLLQPTDYRYTLPLADDEIS